MLKFAPILFAVLYGLITYRMSVWRTHRMLDAQSEPLRDDALNRCTDRLAAALDVAQVPVQLYDIAPINGLAAPDGRIFITRGFYEKYRAGEVSAEEMTSVIAHELGHVALGHAKKRMIDFSGQNALRTALAIVFNRFVPVIGPMISDGLVKLVAARLSREDEYEADEYAAALMVKAGFGIAPQVALFHKLDAFSDKRGGVAPAWLMSHPKTEDRIAALQALETRWQR